MSSANGPSSPANCIGFTRSLTEDTDTANGTGERAVTGAKRLLPKPMHAALAEARLSDFKSMLDDVQRDRWQNFHLFQQSMI